MLNGRGHQRACSYQHQAAAEMPVSIVFLTRQGRFCNNCSCLDQPDMRPIHPVVWEGRSAMGAPFLQIDMQILSP